MGFVDDNNIEDVIEGVASATPTADELKNTPEPGSTSAPEGTPAPPEGTPAVPVVTPEPETVDWSKRVEEWGGEQTVSDAIAIAQALQDDEGVKALVEEGLRHMGLDPAVVLAKPVDPNVEPEDPERLMTAAEVDAKLASIRDSQAQAEQATRDHQAQQAVFSTVEELGLADDDERRIVLGMAQKYAAAEERDPQILSAAIKAGHADYIKTLEAAATKYVTDRKTANDEVPTPLKTGGSPGGEETAPPKNMEEGRAAARRFLKGTGDLESD